MKKLTGPDLIKLFEAYSEKSHKLFIPDIPRQNAVADSLCRHYEADLLEEAVKWYIKENSGPFLVFDFAIESRTLVEKVRFERASSDRFKYLVEETRKRMEES